MALNKVPLGFIKYSFPNICIHFIRNAIHAAITSFSYFPAAFMLDNTRCSCECSHSVRRLLTFCQLVAGARGRGKVWRCGWGQAMPTPSGQLDSRHSRRGEARRGDAARLQIQPEALLNLSRSLPASLSAAASNVSLCATLACLKFQRIRSCAQRASNGICRSQLATSLAMPPLPGRQPGSSRRRCRACRLPN